MTSAASFPPIAELVPHAGPMRLLERVLAHERERTTCALEPLASELFADADGRVPAWVALEWMAQCIAVHGGLLARAAGRVPLPGLLVGARRIELRRAAFARDERLTVRAAFAGAAGELSSFDCELCAGDEPVASGTISVFVSESLLRAPGSDA